MTAAERNYGTPEQEALAGVWAIGKFDQYLWGRHFALHSDQQSLRKLLVEFGDSVVKGLGIRRRMDRLRHYDFDEKHISGKDNLVADFLSRPGETTEPSEVPTLPDDDDSHTISIVDEDTHIPTENFISASQTDPILIKLQHCMRSGRPNIKNIFAMELRHFHKIRHIFLNRTA